MTDRPAPGVHPFARAGFGRAAGAYARSRPSYPADAVAWLVESLGIQPGQLILDVGAGTGKFTALLVPTGARLVAVEPVQEMRVAFRAAVPGVEIVDATAEALPFASGSVDAIVAAQAFHWFETELALAEFRRVLRPAGRLGLVWNVRDTTVPWVAELEAVVEEYAVAAPYDRTSDRRLRANPSFGPPVEREFRHVQVHDRAGLIDRFSSMSFIANLDGAERSTALDRLLEVVDRRGEAADPDRTELPYVTRASWAQRTDGPPD